MKIKHIDEVYDFLKVADSCTGGVKLTSPFGDVYNLKSKLSQFIAVAALLDAHGDEMELWCDDKNDEAKFFRFFDEHPGVTATLEVV